MSRLGQARCLYRLNIDDLEFFMFLRSIGIVWDTTSVKLQVSPTRNFSLTCILDALRYQLLQVKICIYGRSLLGVSQ